MVQWYSNKSCLTGTNQSWSHGEVTKAETINYRTLKPERDGYFVKEFSALLKILNAIVVNIKRRGIRELFVINVVLR